jgi:hypothetical protein
MRMEDKNAKSMSVGMCNGEQYDKSKHVGMNNGEDGAEGRGMRMGKGDQTAKFKGLNVGSGDQAGKSLGVSVRVDQGEKNAEFQNVGLSSSDQTFNIMAEWLKSATHLNKNKTQKSGPKTPLRTVSKNNITKSKKKTQDGKKLEQSSKVNKIIDLYEELSTTGENKRKTLTKITYVRQEKNKKTNEEKVVKNFNIFNIKNSNRKINRTEETHCTSSTISQQMAVFTQRVASPFEIADMGQPISGRGGDHMTAEGGNRPITGGFNTLENVTGRQPCLFDWVGGEKNERLGTTNIKNDRKTN